MIFNNLPSLKRKFYSIRVFRKKWIAGLLVCGVVLLHLSSNKPHLSNTSENFSPVHDETYRISGNPHQPNTNFLNEEIGQFYHNMNPLEISHVSEPPPEFEITYGGSSKSLEENKKLLIGHKRPLHDLIQVLNSPTGQCRKLHRFGGTLQDCEEGEKRGDKGPKMDGHKYICVDPEMQVITNSRNTQDCLVLSFGVNYDISFDEAARAANCEVLMFDTLRFDHTIATEDKYVSFFQVGLARQPAHHYILSLNQTVHFDSFNNLALKHNFTNRLVNILKIDIEGSEWNVLNDLVQQSYLDSVGQIAVEIHGLNVTKLLDTNVKEETVLQTFREVFKGLQERGFNRISYYENYFGGKAFENEPFLDADDLTANKEDSADVTPLPPKTYQMGVSSGSEVLPKQRKSITSSSVGSAIARGSHHQPLPQPTTEGRIKLKTTIDCGSEVLFLKWSNDGTNMAACLRSGEIRLYLPNGHLCHTVPSPEWRPILLDEDRQPTKSNSHNPFDQNVMKSVYEDLMSKYLPHPPATSLIWHSERLNVLTATYSDGQILTWEVPESGGSIRKPVASEKGSGIDVRCAPSPSGGDHSFLTFTANQVVLRDLSTLTPILEFKSPRPVGSPISDMGRIWVISGRGKEVIGGGYSLIWWDVKMGEIKKEIGGIRIRGQAMAVQPNTNRMVTGEYGGGTECVRIWEASSGKVTHTLYSESYETNVKCTTWVGRDIIAIGGSDPHLIRLASLDNTTIGGIKGLRHGITSVDAFASRGHQMSKLAAASGNLVYILDLLK